MRTVLAIDEMLAFEVKGKLSGTVEALDFAAMKALGKEGDAAVRKIVLSAPCVLVIGGRQWNALPMVRSMKLPVRVPVVLVAPTGRLFELAGLAEQLRVFSMVATDREISGPGLATLVASGCRDAWDAVGKSRRRGPLRLLQNPAPPQTQTKPARVLALRRPA